MPKAKTKIGGLVLGGILAAAAGAPALADYPERPVTVIVPWGAGGGTDTITRILAIGLEEQLGQPVNVVNRAGGNGVVGHFAIANAAPDGYTLGACTSEISYFETMGLAPITPDSFTIVSRMATIPAGVTVPTDSDHQDLNALIEAMKAEPKGALSSSGSGLGGPWHMAVAGLAEAAGLPADQVKWVPSQGGAPALQDMVAGGVTMFTGSPVEAQPLADAGEVKVLAVMADERLSTFPDVPTVKEAGGLDWSLSNWFALCGPAGLPDDVEAKLVEAGGAAHAGEAVQSAMAERGITPVWDGPEAATRYAKDFSKTAGGLLTDLGLAK